MYKVYSKKKGKIKILIGNFGLELSSLGFYFGVQSVQAVKMEIKKGKEKVSWTKLLTDKFSVQSVQ